MLTVSEALDRAQLLCDAAAKAGADAADALYYCNAATSVSMRAAIPVSPIPIDTGQSGAG